MKKAEILVLEKDSESVTRTLGDLGAVELTHVRPDPNAGILAVDRSRDLAACRKRLYRVSGLLDVLGLAPSTQPEEIPAAMPPGETDGFLTTLEGQVKKLKKSLAAKKAEENRLRDLVVHMRTFEVLDAPLERLNDFSFLHFAVGSMPQQELTELADTPPAKALILPYVTADGRQKVVAVSDKKGRFSLETALSRHRFEADTISPEMSGLPAEILRQAERQMDGIRRELARNEATRDGLRQQYGDALIRLELSLRVRARLLEASEHFGRTWATCLIGGWVPAERADEVRSAVEAATDGRTIVELRAAEEIDEVPPVLYSNPPFLKPFELLVGTYSHPTYGEIEPTLFVAVAFLLMFGMMFGDVGQGAVLALIGLLVARRAQTVNAHKLGGIIGYAGLAAIVFGFVYGSFFGLEGIVPPLWMTPLKGESRLLFVAVGFGVALISLGLVANMINRARAREYGELFLSRTGLAGGFFYWAAIGLAVRAFTMESGQTAAPLLERLKADPVSVVLMWLIGLPLVLLILRVPIERLVSRRKSDDPGIGAGIFNGVMEVMETVTGFLANTISFVRIAALAIAHFALCLAVFSIVQMVRAAPAGIFWSAVVLILGNALIIGLEGLVASIQGMRLSYYEFFSRFLQGGGKVFEPFRIDTSVTSRKQASE